MIVGGPLFMVPQIMYALGIGAAVGAEDEGEGQPAGEDVDDDNQTMLIISSIFILIALFFIMSFIFACLIIGFIILSQYN
tara:strand:+ start:91 stop:330 length:240 start_codon:yes stop_codon:yes gene_type:complete